MRRRLLRPILSGMQTTVVIALSLDEGRCLSGELRSHGDSIPFHGWLGLFAALDRLLGEAATESRGAELAAARTRLLKGDPK
jgi:hypothetical protein